MGYMSHRKYRELLRKKRGEKLNETEIRIAADTWAKQTSKPETAKEETSEPKENKAQTEEGGA
jgi:hypothetical protein